MRVIVCVLTILLMQGCEQMPARQLYNPSKPISAYDSDLYNCRMMAMQMNPQPRVNQGTDTKCSVLFGTLTCEERPAAQQPDPLDFLRQRNINIQTEDCMSRQGWRMVAVGTIREQSSTRKGMVSDTERRAKNSLERNRDIGSPCVTDSQCIRGFCIMDSDAGYMQCQENTKSARKINKTNVNTPITLREKDRPCVSDKQCVEGLKCIPTPDEIKRCQ